MSLSKAEYISCIKEKYPSNKISMITLIETIVESFGDDNTMKSDELLKILGLLLSCDLNSINLIFAICNDPVYSKKLQFHYDTSLEEGIISEKK